jgi:hypothetical protein
MKPLRRANKRALDLPAHKAHPQNRRFFYLSDQYIHKVAIADIRNGRPSNLHLAGELGQYVLLERPKRDTKLAIGERVAR